MCGLVAVRGVTELSLLGQAARAAARRGPHSYGWAWRTGAPGDDWQTSYGPGPLPEPPPQTGGCMLVVGHSRLATCGSRPGDMPPVSEAQPFIDDWLLVAHNGTVTDPDRIAGRHVDVDSQAILIALKAGQSVEEVFARIGDAPQAAIIANMTGFVVVRMPGRKRPAHPLWELDVPTGVYISSQPFHPACRLLPEGITCYD